MQDVQDVLTQLLRNNTQLSNAKKAHLIETMAVYRIVREVIGESTASAVLTLTAAIANLHATLQLGLTSPSHLSQNGAPPWAPTSMPTAQSPVQAPAPMPVALAATVPESKKPKKKVAPLGKGYTLMVTKTELRTSGQENKYMNTTFVITRAPDQIDEPGQTPEKFEEFRQSVGMAIAEQRLMLEGNGTPLTVEFLIACGIDIPPDLITLDISKPIYRLVTAEVKFYDKFNNEEHEKLRNYRPVDCSQERLIEQVLSSGPGSI